MPCGLNSAPFLFTKIVHPLVKFLHKHLVKMFLARWLECITAILRTNLQFPICRRNFAKIWFYGFFGFKCGKSNWELQELMTWPEITLDLRAKAFYISNTGIESILNTLNNMTGHPFVRARKVAPIFGNTNSITFLLGNNRLKTRYLYKSILASTL